MCRYIVEWIDRCIRSSKCMHEAGAPEFGRRREKKGTSARLRLGLHTLLLLPILYVE